MTTATRFAAAIGTLTTALLLTGCGSSSHGAAFQTQSGVAPDAAGQSCLVHQKSNPTADYKGGPNGSTTDVLTFLAYYTANGNKKFCDNKAANSKDKSWAALYTSLDGPTAAKNVKGISG
jgi:hypothetical protein